MRTKHLFYTAAMAALFAACVNDDFETISKGQNTANDGRPVVSNVKLNFTTGADTRLAFGEDGYAWETNDTIGALLMDNVLTLDENKSWLQKYQLVSNIHTSYPFTYSTSDQTWGCNTKMLEGNYFFAYPWEDYDGRREVAHSLLKQSQTGIGSNVVAESYADNQFFIGYSQIKAGTDAKDALTDVEMVPLLGAIQLRIVNTGTQSYHLNKIVLSGNDGIASVMTFDPTNAAYDETAYKWNLEQSRLSGPNLNWSNATATTFNYANYTDNEADLYNNAANDPHAVYNIKDGDKYDRIEALRAVAQEHAVLSTEQSAQLTINGTAEERELLPGQKNTAYVLIMCNPIEVEEVDNDATNGKGLFLSIYADEGFVQNINLSKVNGESTSNTVVTDAAVEEVGPNVKNTIRVQLEDNSFITPETMTVYNSADLLQFIEWNAQITGRRNMVATLGQDITFTNEMFEALVGNDPKVDLNKYLTIDCKGNKLTLAEDVPADVLDSKYLTINGDIIVKGELELTEDSKIKDDAVLTIEKEASLTINDEKAVVPGTIKNDGTVTIGANSALKSSLVITNNGTIEVAKGGDSKAQVTNNADAIINNNGFMQNVTNNEDGIINLGENSTISVENSGKVVTAKGATVNGTNYGEIVYVEGATVNANNSGSEALVSYEYTGSTITSKTFEDLKNINKIILTKSTTVTENTTLANVEINEGGELIVNEKVKLTVIGELNISGEATISGKGTGANQGKVVAAKVVVEEEGVLNNSAVIQANTEFKNDGMVYNNGTVYTDNYQQGVNGTWKYENYEEIPTTVDDQQVAMDNAVKGWAGLWTDFLATPGTFATYYAGDPYDIDAFVATMDTWINADPAKKAVAQALYDEWCDATDTDADTFAEVLNDKNATAVTKFNAAVNKIVLATNWTTTLSKTIINTTTGAFKNFTMPSADATLYDNEAAAYDAFAKYVASATITGVTDAAVKASIWTVADADIKEALAATNVDGSLYYLNGAYAYIWKGCKLDVVMTAYNQRDITGWNTALSLSAGKTLSAVVDRATLVAWMNAIYNASSTGNSFVDNAKEAIKDYIAEFEDWGYVASQIKGLNTKDK